METWEAAKREVCGELRPLAAAERTIAYGELADRVRAIRFDPHDTRFHSLLGEVSIDEHRSGRPLLSIIVRPADDERPGKGFFTLARSLGLPVLDQDVFWASELNTVFKHWKSARQEM